MFANADVFLLFRSKLERASDSGDSDNNNNTGEEGGEEAEDEDDEYDEEYVPEWHEDYDEDDIDEDDFFSDDDESENLERDFSPFDWIRRTQTSQSRGMRERTSQAPPRPSPLLMTIRRHLRTSGRMGDDQRDVLLQPYLPPNPQPQLHSLLHFLYLPSVFSRRRMEADDGQEEHKFAILTLRKNFKKFS